MTSPDPLAGLRDELSQAEAGELEAMIAEAQEIGTPQAVRHLRRKAAQEKAHTDAALAAYRRLRSGKTPTHGAEGT